MKVLKKLLLLMSITLAVQSIAHAQAFDFFIKPNFGIMDYTAHFFRDYNLGTFQYNTISLETEDGYASKYQRFSSFTNTFVENFRNPGIGAGISLGNRFGMDLSASIKRESLRLRFPHDNEFIRFNRVIFRPEAKLKIGIVHIAAMYNKVLKCKDKTFNYDKSCSEDGFTGKIDLYIGPFGFGFQTDFFNYFNKNFTPDGVTYPFADMKIRSGAIRISYRLSKES